MNFKPQPAPYCAVETKNVPPEISAAIASHYWTLQESKKSSYIDLLNVLEIIQVDNENRRRDYEWHDMIRRQMDYG